MTDSILNRRHMLVTGLGGLAALTIPGTALAESRETRFNFTGSFGSSSSYRSTYRGKKLVKFRSNEPVGTLIIKTSERRLYRVLPNGMAMKYGVGVGRRGFEWSGIARIKVKKEWPAWRPPAEMIQRELVKYGRRLPDVMPGGPNNPLGARAMYLFKGNRDTLYRIHGTNNPASIGKAQSSGCIRMMNEEIIELYNKTPIGTKVIVI